MTDLVGVIRGRMWWIGAVMALAAGAGLVLGWLSPAESRSRTRLLLVDTSEERALSEAPAPLPLDERRSAVISRVESQRTRDEVTRALGLAPDDVTGISAEAEEGDGFVTIAVTTVDDVDAATAADEVAATVAEQQRAAARARADTLADQLRRSAAGIDAEIDELDARLAASARDIALLELEVSRNTGTPAGVDPFVELSQRNDAATGLRSTRAALLSSRAEIERRAREAEVAAAVASGGLEAYGPAEAASTSRTLPPLQLSVLLASIGLVVMVGAAYFTAYRAEAPPQQAGR